MRDTLRKIMSQCREEGLAVPFELQMSEAVFAGNALITVNGSTPYNAVYGRVPRLLPGIEQIDALRGLDPERGATVLDG